MKFCSFFLIFVFICISVFRYYLIPLWMIIINKMDNVWIMNMLMDICGKLNWQIIVIISG